VHVLRASTVDELRKALTEAKAHEGGPVMVHVDSDPLVPAPGSDSWWDVPVAEVSALDATRQARDTYTEHKQRQRHYVKSSSNEEGVNS